MRRLLLATLLLVPIAAHADSMQEWQKTGQSLADLVAAGMTVFSVQSIQLNNGTQRIFWLRGVLDGRSTLAQCGEDFIGMRTPSGAVAFSMTDVGCGTLVNPHRVK
jgi:hypothetical protein